MSIVREIRDLMSRVSRVEQQVSKLPSRISSAVGGGGGGIIGYEVDFIEDLPEVAPMPRKSLAWVNATNGLYMRNAANNGWICLNRFE